MRLAMIKAMKYWVYTANIDGFRCDFADGPPVDFWKQAIDTLRNISTHKLLLMAEGQRSDNYGAGFDYHFGFKFFENLKDVYAHDRSVLVIDSLNVREYKGTTNGQQIIRYINNHDVNGSDGTPLFIWRGERLNGCFRRGCLYEKCSYDIQWAGSRNSLQISLSIHLKKD